MTLKKLTRKDVSWTSCFCNVIMRAEPRFRCRQKSTASRPSLKESAQVWGHTEPDICKHRHTREGRGEETTALNAFSKLLFERTKQNDNRELTMKQNDNRELPMKQNDNREMAMKQNEELNMKTPR